MAALKIRAFVLTAALALGVVAHPGARQDPALSVKITSPLGRTGLPGTVRIVAQVRHPQNAPPGQVRFYVDQQLLGTVTDGPPYATEWVDENPFERREISVEVLDRLGHEARDTVVLEPFEIAEAAEVNSVLLEASVQDKTGRFIKGLPATSFAVTENDVPQQLDIVRQEAVGATFALMVDASASMSRRMDFVHRTAATLSSYLTPLDRMIVAPFSTGVAGVTGPTNDRATILQGIAAIRPAGGTAILDSLVEVAHSLEHAEGRRAIVLITDGYDERSKAQYDDAIGAVRAAGATVYVVGIGGVAGISIKGERLLRQLAVETGGRFFFPSRDEQLAIVHDTLTEDVQNRYLITYTPTDQKTDGTWRAVRVWTGDATNVIRVRPGYFAPRPTPIRPRLEFTATDPSGRYLDLSKDSLEVFEDGAPQVVETFQEAVEEVSIVLALDSSGSMKRKETDVIASAQDFVGALQDKDSLALLTFGDKATFAHDFSRNRDYTRRAIGEYRAIGGTALYDALYDSLQRVKNAEGRRVVVVMTDGRDENNAGNGPGSTHKLDEVLKLVKDSGAMVYAIGLGTNLDRTALQQFADLSGGRAFFPSDVSGLAAEYRRVIDDLRRRYVIGYTSTRIEHDGRFRAVQIKIKDAPAATVRTSGGYTAPAK
ncbi:MAG: VWA domain-containing protein [Vicinamibacterales bacterium]